MVINVFVIGPYWVAEEKMHCIFGRCNWFLINFIHTPIQAVKFVSRFFSITQILSLSRTFVKIRFL